MHKDKKKKFLVGRFCHKRCYLFHLLHHYKFYLRKQIQNEIRKHKGISDPSKVLNEIDKSSFKQDEYRHYKSILSDIDHFRSQNTTRSTSIL